jgi:2-aminoadipate transaminase
VITAGTFSKTIATGLRVGWVQAPTELTRSMLATRFDMGNSPVLHRMLSEYLASGEFEDHVETMRALYRRKVEVVAGTLRRLARRHLEFDTPDGGFFLWLRLQGGLTAADVQAAAMEEGVMFPVGEAFYPGRDPGPDGEHIRLAYSWTGESDLPEAGSRLATALDRVASGT